MANSPTYSFPLLTAQQAGAETRFNWFVHQIEALLGAQVEDRDLTAPPGSPSDGDVYIPTATATGDWVGQENKLAIFSPSGATNGWDFVTPQLRRRWWVVDEAIWIEWNGTAWVRSVPDVPLVETSAANYSATAENHTILCDTTSNQVTVDLPAASSSTGLVLAVIKKDSSVNLVVIDGNASETIDGSTTLNLSNQYDSVTIQCDGTEWFSIK